MCTRITCRECGCPTYAGCGAHIEQVLGDVPPAQRCHCREAKTKDPRQAAAQPSHTSGATPPGAGAKRSWLQQLLGR